MPSLANVDHRQSLHGWGKYPVASCRVRAPQAPHEVAPLLDPAGTIARGLGRSYGDPALNDGGTVLRCTGMDRYLAFDEATGTLTCEAGVSLAQIIADFVPRGFFPMVTPGTKHVTVGGCIANDVHGKAHHVDGCFSRCVDEFTILLADGTIHTARRDQEPELFWANFGGMGLLGVILTATLRLRPIETAWFRKRTIQVDDLDAMLDAIDAHDEPYSVAWVDPRATGRALGRGLLTVGDHAARDELPPELGPHALRVGPPARLTVPFDLPSWSLNRLTAPPLNMVIGYLMRRGGDFAHYDPFFYPLDILRHWNRGYGRRGFTQYQFVVPLQDGRRHVRALLQRIMESRWLPFLNVLKKFGPEEEHGVLSFPFEGYTFAIDFPVRPGIGPFLHELDQLVLDAGGRVYLGKDAFLDRPTFEAMYAGKLDAWRRAKAHYDPHGMFTSDLGRRVGLCPG
ncbi:MAG: FAD-binding oxidoreductase [Myxococcales bacterium]|nr:FAD-binding oxidoreductase [Myxococcales bacterium]